VPSSSTRLTWWHAISCSEKASTSTIPSPSQPYSRPRALARCRPRSHCTSTSSWYCCSTNSTGGGTTTGGPHSRHLRVLHRLPPCSGCQHPGHPNHGACRPQRHVHPVRALVQPRAADALALCPRRPHLLRRSYPRRPPLAPDGQCGPIVVARHHHRRPPGDHLHPRPHRSAALGFP
jgi:hypothetical protein